MKKLIITLMVLALSIPTLASALTYSPTLSDLANWTKIDSSHPGTTFSAESRTSTVKFTGNILGGTIAAPINGFISIGQTSPLDLLLFSDFALRISNLNESIWNYSLFAIDSGNNVATMAPVSINVGDTATLQLNLAGLDLDDIISIGFKISQTIPITVPDPEGDRTYETAVAPVPEPGTMMLLGAGFLGLAIYGKRRKNA